MVTQCTEGYDTRGVEPGYTVSIFAVLARNIFILNSGRSELARVKTEKAAMVVMQGDAAFMGLVCLKLQGSQFRGGIGWIGYD